MFAVPLEPGVNWFLSYLWDQTDVDVAEVLPLHFKLELSEGLDKRHALNVSHGASKLQTLLG